MVDPQIVLREGYGPEDLYNAGEVLRGLDPQFIDEGVPVEEYTDRTSPSVGLDEVEVAQLASLLFPHLVSKRSEEVESYMRQKIIEEVVEFMLLQENPFNSCTPGALISTPKISDNPKAIGGA